MEDELKEQIEDAETEEKKDIDAEECEYYFLDDDWQLYKTTADGKILGKVKGKGFKMK